MSVATVGVTCQLLGLAPEPPDERLVGFAIDAPRVGDRSQTYAMRLSGWVLGRAGAVRELAVAHPGGVVRRLAIDLPRPDLARLHPDLPHAATCGFDARVSTIGLPPDCELSVSAVLDDDRSVCLSRLTVRHTPLATTHEPALQPLLVTSLFRMGTTRLMRLLGCHPEVLVHAIYPYEVRQACYWMHALKVLSEPANLHESCHPDRFRSTSAWLGNNPFHRAPMVDDPTVERWMGRDAVHELAAFSQAAVESFYARVAAAQDQTRPRYFAEKHIPDGPHAWMMWGLYPRAREIFLVRDFRDVVCSILAFNARRGYASFGRERVDSDEAMVADLGVRLARLLWAWRARSARARLVRYEELVTEPRRVVRELLDYLEVDASEETTRRLLAEADRDTPELRRHRTSGSARESIGRWRRELPPPLAERCQRVMAPTLAAFGY